MLNFSFIFRRKTTIDDKKNPTSWEKAKENSFLCHLRKGLAGLVTLIKGKNNFQQAVDLFVYHLKK